MLDRLESSPKISVTPFLKHMGRTKEEQIQKNQSAMELLREWLEEEVTEEESKQRESYFESFKEIVDSGRLSERKLYFQE